MSGTIPIIDGLVLGDSPHLVAQACVSCGVRFIERRNGCASCGGTEFAAVELSTTGTVRAYSIVYMAPPGVEVPYVSCVVDLDDGTRVRATLRDVDPDPIAMYKNPATGMRVRLVTFVVGTDTSKTEAIGYAFSPRADGFAPVVEGSAR